jgi:hypothetical protein
MPDIDLAALSNQLREMLQRILRIKNETQDKKVIDRIDNCVEDIASALDGISHNTPGIEKQCQKALDGSKNLINRINDKGSNLFNFTILIIVLLVAAYVVLHWLHPTTASGTFIWSEVPLNYIEVVFWSLFGLLTWAIFNMSDWASNGERIGLWSNWLIARSLQGVFISMVVVIAVQQIDLGTSTVSKTFIPAVLAFILGYYSERGREYLEILRDKVFPTTQSPFVTINNNERSTQRSSIVITGNSNMGSSTAISSLSPEGVIKVNNKPPTSISIDGNGIFCERVELESGYNSIKVEVKTSNKKNGFAWYEIYYTKNPVLHISAQADPTGGKAQVSGEVDDETGNPVKDTAVMLKTNQMQFNLVYTDQNGQFSQEIDLATSPNAIAGAVWPIPGIVGADVIQLVKIKP